MERRAPAPRSAERRARLFVPLAFPLVGLIALLAAVGAAPAARADKLEWKFAFIGPLSGPLAASGRESLEGVRAALQAKRGQLGAKPPELLELDDGDDVKKAEAALAKAQAAKVDAIFSAATGVTIDALVPKVRKSGPLLLLVGSAGAPPVASLEDPIASIGGWPAEHVTALVDFLEIPCHSAAPALVVEETPRGHEFVATLTRNLPERIHLAGTLFVKPHATPARAELAKARDNHADRVVISGEPDLVDAVAAELLGLDWKVPLYLDDGLLSTAAASLGDGRAADGFALVAPPRFCMKPPDELLAAWQKTSPGATWLPPRLVRAYAMASLFADAVAGLTKRPKRDELVAALRAVPYGEEESQRPLLDATGRSARTAWLPWSLGAKGPQADDPARYLDPDFGPLLRARKPSLYKAEPGTKVVWLSFGDAKSKAVRSIEEDLSKLGLITKGYEAAMDEWILDELMARALAKINRLYLKNEDGSFIPGVSFAISFTVEKPKELKPGEYFTAVIAGDDPETGGRAWPGEGRCEIYSTFMERTIFLKDKLVPPLQSEDRRYFTGAYVWATNSAENLRAKTIRNLLDCYAGSFALTGAHEVGHLCGLGHDTSDPRSLMNVQEGGGLRETSACWIPEHVKILERFLGRYDPAKKPRR